MFKNIFIGSYPDQQFLVDFKTMQSNNPDWPIEWFSESDLIVVLVPPWHIEIERLPDLTAELQRLAKPLDGFDLLFDVLVAGPDPAKPEFVEALADPPAMLKVFHDYFSRQFGFIEQREAVVPFINLGTIYDETFVFDELHANLRTHVPELVLFESVYQNEADGFSVIDRFNLGD